MAKGDRLMNRLMTMRRLALLLGLAVAACGPGAPPASEGGPVAIRRLTEEQYRRAVADVFGPDIKVAGRFEPDGRRGGLQALGAAMATVTPVGFEQYDAMARAIAAQVVDPQHRDRLGCRPAADAQPDDACTRQVVDRVGKLLLRRPLAPEEVEARVAEAGRVTAALGDYWTGLAREVARLLESPEFLFRMETAAGGRLTPYAKAGRLSFLLWDAAPDEALLQAAAQGRLDRPEGLAAEVDRLMASPRLTDGVRAFFADMLQLDDLDQLAKDPKVYAQFTPKVAEAAREQMLQTLTRLLLDRDGDYRDVFTTRETVMNRALGAAYWVPVASRDAFSSFTFPAGDPRVGIQTQLAFTALHAHPGRSSPTLRGKAVREILLCQPVAAPPANVSFKLVQETDNAQYRTGRARLQAHAEDPTCAGCHKVIDPVGLALENFDGAGRFRAQENGVAIDASGELSGRRFEDSAGLGQALHDDPAAPACLVDMLVRYGAGHDWQPGEKAWEGWLKARFAQDGYRLRPLLRQIATSDGFYRVSTPAIPAKPQQEASR
jgi:hypothetical protein